MDVNIIAKLGSQASIIQRTIVYFRWPMKVWFTVYSVCVSLVPYGIELGYMKKYLSITCGTMIWCKTKLGEPTTPSTSRSWCGRECRLGIAIVFCLNLPWWRLEERTFLTIVYKLALQQQCNRQSASLESQEFGSINWVWSCIGTQTFRATSANCTNYIVLQPLEATDQCLASTIDLYL